MPAVQLMPPEAEDFPAFGMEKMAFQIFGDGFVLVSKGFSNVFYICFQGLACFLTFVFFGGDGFLLI